MKGKSTNRMGRSKKSMVTVKLLVDNERNRIVFAESDKDFIDILFSFLTMPVATIVRLVGKESKESDLGCMDMLYKSVKDLDIMHLQSETCKNMLTHPTSASEEECKNLAVVIDDTEITRYYRCRTYQCSTHNHRLITTVKNAKCRCEGPMIEEVPKCSRVATDDAADGVFVKGSHKFMISDDLKISVLSTRACLSLFKKLGISEGIALEERVVYVNDVVVLHLLKQSLLSKTPLSDVFLPERGKGDQVDLEPKVLAPGEREMTTGGEKMCMKLQQRKSNKVSHAKDQEDCVTFLAILLGSVTELLCSNMKNVLNTYGKKISIKLLRRKSKEKVVYAEVGEDFINLLFSFLTFPLGSIAKFFNGHTSMGCVDKLYKSVGNLKDHMKSDQCKALLLDPKLPPYFGCKNQLLRISEVAPFQPLISYCHRCFVVGTAPDFGKCPHGRETVQLRAMNPVHLDGKIKSGGFVKGPTRFMVTDDLHVEPLSVIAGISIVNRFNLPMSDLKEQFVNVGEEEALNLLKASLLSQTALSDAFLTVENEALQ
ncbi:uncharacterized protein LOC131240152 [Magnolia sinica]|uniref:uncharacterized protein LOC131240152 n=1 Tax=Magnolia sinica TaxID=86752 RepID=UPI00265A18FE|nr:uncharacterized protein LOC131240152 [Magnolia sinica]